MATTLAWLPAWYVGAMPRKCTYVTFMAKACAWPEIEANQDAAAIIFSYSHLFCALWKELFYTCKRAKFDWDDHLMSWQVTSNIGAINEACIQSDHLNIAELVVWILVWIRWSVPDRSLPIHWNFDTNVLCQWCTIMVSAFQFDRCTHVSQTPACYEML